jgi:electron transport complex protein RnfG
VVDLIKLIFALTIISAAAGLAMGVASSKTEANIAARQAQIRQAAIASVFPEGVAIKEEKGEAPLPGKYWSASKGGAPIGYAFEMSGRGYAGDIKFMAGIDPSGKILGLTVLDQHETPGLGSRVNEVASTKYVWYPIGGDDKAKPWFSEQFEGLSSLKQIGIDKTAGEWHKLDDAKRAELRGKNTVTAITGSTISTAAVTRSISQKAGEYLKALQ